MVNRIKQPRYLGCYHTVGPLAYGAGRRNLLLQKLTRHCGRPDEDRPCRGRLQYALEPEGPAGYNKSSCPSALTVSFFFGRALGEGSSTSVSSDSSFPRMSRARSMTLTGRPARRATWMP